MANDLPPSCRKGYNGCVKMLLKYKEAATRFRIRTALATAEWASNRACPSPLHLLIWPFFEFYFGKSGFTADFA